MFNHPYKTTGLPISSNKNPEDGCESSPGRAAVTKRKDEGIRNRKASRKEILKLASGEV